MEFEEFRQFIENDMSMAHVYQPVMLIELLKRGGRATVRDIAQSILNRDPTQLDYYSEIVKGMVGRVLTTNRKVTEKTGDTYVLKDFEKLTPQQIEQLATLCQERLTEFERKRGNAIWEHRRRGHRPISGSVRFQVLKRASFRCELCGISADDKNIEVDHIHPKSIGGTDDISNYQALCYSCNAAKRNTDKTDFRQFKTLYANRDENCPFCNLQTIDRGRIVDENNLAVAIRDGFPVTNGHTLLIPKRHVQDYFGLLQPEVNSINQLMHRQSQGLKMEDESIEGFNIGMNCGETAGQSVAHCHVHLIPRRKGDVENPRGGIRHVIPGKGYY